MTRLRTSRRLLRHLWLVGTPRLGVDRGRLRHQVHRDVHRLELGQGPEPAVGDLDGDGALDIALAAYEEHTVYVFLDVASYGGSVSVGTADRTFTNGGTPDDFGVGLTVGDLTRMEWMISRSERRMTTPSIRAATPRTRALCISGTAPPCRRELRCRVSERPDRRDGLGGWVQDVLLAADLDGWRRRPRHRCQWLRRQRGTGVLRDVALGLDGLGGRGCSPRGAQRGR